MLSRALQGVAVWSLRFIDFTLWNPEVGIEGPVARIPGNILRNKRVFSTGLAYNADWNPLLNFDYE